MKYRIAGKHEYGAKSVTLYKTEIPNAEAEFAMKLIEKFGLIASKDNGEDSAGRQKHTYLPAYEVVARAFGIAEATFRTIRAKNLMIPLPDLNEINAEYDKKYTR